MVADLGTKALTSTRIEVLKSMLGMNKVDRPAEEEGEVNEKPEKKAIKTGVAEVAATAIKLITHWQPLCQCPMRKKRKKRTMESSAN